MAHITKNETMAHDQQKLGSTQSVSLASDTLKVKEKAEKAKHTAVLLAEIEELAETLLDSTTSSKKAGKNASNLENKSVKGSSEDTSTQSVGGKDFFVSNMIPFKMFVDMMQERLKQANLNGDLGSMMALAYAGVNKNVDKDGNCSFSQQEGGGIVANMCDAVLQSGMQQATLTQMDATQTLSQGISVLGSAAVMGAMCGSTTKEDGHISKIQNAIAAEDKIKQMSDLNVGDLAGMSRVDEDGNVLNSNGTINQDHKVAVAALTDGGYDFREDGNHFGSIVEKREASRFRKEKITVTRAESNIANVNKVNLVIKAKVGFEGMSVEKAITNATVEQRIKIRKQMQVQLKDAKAKLAAKETSINQKRETLTKIVQSFGTAGAGGIKMASSANATQKAEYDAQNKLYESVGGTIQKLGNAQSEAYKTDRQRVDSANQDLQNLIRQTGQRG